MMQELAHVERLDAGRPDGEQPMGDRAGAGAGLAVDGRPVAWREAAVDRFLALRPAVMARMNDPVRTEQRSEFESITVHQLKALVRLPAEGLTMHELAGLLGITGATACALADRLVAQGLAERRADYSDRRVVRLCPSPCGSSLAERHRRAQRQGVVALLELLSDSQVAAWLEIMETLAGAPPEAVGGRP